MSHLRRWSHLWSEASDFATSLPFTLSLIWHHAYVREPPLHWPDHVFCTLLIDISIGQPRLDTLNLLRVSHHGPGLHVPVVVTWYKDACMLPPPFQFIWNHTCPKSSIFSLISDTKKYNMLMFYDVKYIVWQYSHRSRHSTPTQKAPAPTRGSFSYLQMAMCVK